MSQLSNRSSVRSDVPLICSQDLSDSSSESHIKDKPTKSVTMSQSSDGFTAIKTIKLKIGSQDTSQSSIGRTDVWKGSQVVNYKTFKKVSQNSSQNSPKVMIPLKKVKVNNDFIKNWLQNDINDRNEDKQLENESSFT